MGRKARTPSNLLIDFLSPRWINRYIIQSIKKTGGISEAYELLLQDVSSLGIHVAGRCPKCGKTVYRIKSLVECVLFCPYCRYTRGEAKP